MNDFLLPLFLLSLPAGTASSDPDGNDDIASYKFELLSASTQAVVATKVSTSGKANISQADGLSGNTQYTVKLSVKDKSGLDGTATQTLSVGNCPPTAVMAVSPSATISCGGSVTMDASASKDADGSISSYTWKLLYGNQTVTKTGVTATVAQLADKLVTGATYALTLTVKDDLSGSNTSTGTLKVQTGCVTNNPPVCTNAKPSVSRISTLVSFGL